MTQTEQLAIACGLVKSAGRGDALLRFLTRTEQSPLLRQVAQLVPQGLHAGTADLMGSPEQVKDRTALVRNAIADLVRKARTSTTSTVPTTMKQAECLNLALVKSANFLPAPSGISPTNAGAYFRGFGTGPVVGEGASALSHTGRLGMALAGLLGAAGLGYAGTHHHAAAPAAPAQPEAPAGVQLGGHNFNFGQLGQQLNTQLGPYAQYIPAALGLLGGGVGGAFSGHPLSGAATGLATGAGMTAGGMGGKALAGQLGVNDPTAQLLFTLGGGALGGALSNRLMNGLVGPKKHQDEA